LEVVDPGTRRQSRIGSLGQLLREPPGSNCSRAKPSFAHARVPLKYGRHTRVAPYRTAVLGCIEAPPSSSCSTAAFAPQLLLPTCRAISSSPPPLGSRSTRTWPPPNSPRAVRSAAGLRPLPSSRRPQMSITRDPLAHQLSRRLSSPSWNTVTRCMPSPCTPRNCSSSSCCWTRARFGLVASHLHMSEPRASLTRSHFAGSASLLPWLAFRRTPWLRPRYGYRVPASAHARLYVVDLLGHLSWRTAPARTARVPLTPPVRAARSCAYTRACSAPRCPCAPFAACCAHSSTCRARQSCAPTLLLRPPNTCTRHRLPHARSLLPPLHRRPCSNAPVPAHPFFLCHLSVAQRSRATRAAPAPVEPLVHAPSAVPPARAPPTRPRAPHLGPPARAARASAWALPAPRSPRPPARRAPARACPHGAPLRPGPASPPGLLWLLRLRAHVPGSRAPAPLPPAARLRVPEPLDAARGCSPAARPARREPPLLPRPAARAAQRPAWGRRSL
jgi:hypothetical protein